MKFNYIVMHKNNTKLNHKQIENWLLKMEELIGNMRCYLDHIKGGQGQQILSEKQKIMVMPVHPKVVDAIMRSPTAKTPQAKIAMAKQFQKAKLAKAQLRGAIAQSASQMTDDDLALSFINQNTTGQPYKIVPDASGKTGK